MVVAILGQDSSLHCDPCFRFPTLIFWLLRITLVRTTSCYDRSYTYQFPDAMYSHRSILLRRSTTVLRYTSLHYSLHTTVTKAVSTTMRQRSYPTQSIQWTLPPPIQSNACSSKSSRTHDVERWWTWKWQVCTLKTCALGYMVLAEKGVLQKDASKDGHYDWHDPFGSKTSLFRMAYSRYCIKCRMCSWKLSKKFQMYIA